MGQVGFSPVKTEGTEPTPDPSSAFAVGFGATTPKRSEGGQEGNGPDASERRLPSSSGPAVGGSKRRKYTAPAPSLRMILCANKRYASAVNQSISSPPITRHPSTRPPNSQSPAIANPCKKVPGSPTSV